MTDKFVKGTSDYKRDYDKEDCDIADGRKSALDIFAMNSDYRFVITLPGDSRGNTVVISNENVTPAKVLNLINTLGDTEGVRYRVSGNEEKFNVTVNNVDNLLYAIRATVDATDIYDYFINCISTEEDFKGKTYIESINKTISKIDTDEYTKQVFRTALDLFIRNAI